MNLKNFSFTKEWTLFLDRDGVISWRKPGDYIRTWDEFRFLDGVLEAMAVFSGIFGRIVIVSNQQGVGKGLMNASSLTEIDIKMKEEIGRNGGRIDSSYYCTHLASENHPDRKPNTGMGLKAKSDFPEIDFTKSVMVGDSVSDMEFGRRLGMTTVLISESNDCIEPVDFQFISLRNFADLCESLRHNVR